jgi:hypothetical protein
MRRTTPVAHPSDTPAVPGPASADGRAAPPGSTVFPFRFSPSWRLASALFGVASHTSWVEVSEWRLHARFGPWSVTTPLTNVAEVGVTGPYRFHRAAGSARYSLADGGLTFASTGERGLCIRFHEPVPGIEPTGVLRHGDLTVTVDDVEGLAGVLVDRAGAADVVRLDGPSARRRRVRADGGHPAGPIVGRHPVR